MTAKREAYPAQAETIKITKGANGIKYSYFLTLNDWCAIYTFQNGKCAVCDKILRNKFTGENPDGKLPATDHDHATGAIRGLICTMPCNFLLGEVYSLDTVKRLVAYIEKPPATDALGSTWYTLPGRLGTKIWQERKRKYKDLPRLNELGLEGALAAYYEAHGKDWNVKKNQKA